MATLDQVAAQIRFQLEQLSERNAHHDFEHLCRWLARNRICSNILPSTGPVSAYGDQGSDFESFRTYLLQSPLSNSSFLGIASDRPIVFACTVTDKSRIKSKIMSDVDLILKQGTRPLDLHYFCATDVAVGLRHELIDWAKVTYNVSLEIHDGQAISEYLTDPDIFWIAERFLNVPSEIYPSLPSDKIVQWYDDLIAKWKNADFEPDDFADFSEIKAAIRHATFAEDAKRDLPFWIDKMEMLQKSSSSTEIRRKGTYEISVARLRGMGSLTGHENEISSYFEELQNMGSSSDLEDAVNLWTYCLGAIPRNAIQIKQEDLLKWNAKIRGRIESELNSNPTLGKLCSILENRGSLEIMGLPGQELSSKIDSAIASWLELVNVVSKAPLFPLERFADRLTVLLELPGFADVLGNNPKFFELTQKVDEQLAIRNGGFIAAEKCRDRAMAFHKQGDLLRAIKEVHKAKVKWFASETLRGSLLAALFLSGCYEELGLLFAAKYYALVTSHIALNNPLLKIQSLIPRGIIMAASHDYALGSFCGFFDFSDVGLQALSIFPSSIDPSNPHNEINRTLFHASILYAITKVLNPDFLKYIDSRIENWPNLKDPLNKLILEADIKWSTMTMAELWKTSEKQFLGRPYSDLGRMRKYEFQALGVTWRFKWENTYELTISAEELIVILQIILSDLADSDLFLLRTVEEVEIELADKISIVENPSNDEGSWSLKIKEGMAIDEANNLALQVSFSLLQHCSLLPTDSFTQIMEKAFSNDLVNKMFFGERYSVMYRELVNGEKFDQSKRHTMINPHEDLTFSPIFHSQLNWYGDLGPRYNEKDVQTALENRYTKPLIPIKYTLSRLVEEKAFQDVVKQLRGMGWLDWHILTGISLIVLNYRINKRSKLAIKRDDFQKDFFELANTPEEEDAEPVPLQEFSIDNMVLSLNMSMQSTLKALGFELHQRTPTVGAISDFLGNRYKYWSDDIEHPDFGF